MLQKSASWLVALMLLGGASWASIRAFCAGNIVATAPVSCGPQFMLYVTPTPVVPRQLVTAPVRLADWGVS